jgi:hypothetical protein
VNKDFVLLEKLVIRRNSSKPRRSTHSRSRKTGILDHFRIQYNKITLKIIE